MPSSNMLVTLPSYWNHPRLSSLTFPTRPGSLPTLPSRCPHYRLQQSSGRRLTPRTARARRRRQVMAGPLGGHGDEREVGAGRRGGAGGGGRRGRAGNRAGNGTGARPGARDLPLLLLDHGGRRAPPPTPHWLSVPLSPR